MSYFFQSSFPQGDGSGKYTLQQVEGLQPGTKIVLSLRKEDAEFSDETIVRDIVKKYSNFVGTDVHLNGEKINTLQPVWLMDPKEADANLHEEFYRLHASQLSLHDRSLNLHNRYISGGFDKPRFTLHYRTDAPMDIRALLYVPESRPGMFETARDAESGVALYCRKVP